MTRTAQQALSALRNVSPAQVAAMVALQEADPAALAALTTAVRKFTRREESDVQEHAAIICAHVYAGTPDGASPDARIEHAARLSRTLARRTVAESREEESYGMAEDCDVLMYGDDGAPATAVAMPEAPRADAKLRVTYSDLIATVRGRVAATDPAACASLDRAIEDYRRHAATDCAACADRPGRRPTLSGMTAHVEGWHGTDREFHASRRATLAALRAVPGHGAVSECGHKRDADHGKASCAPAVESWTQLAATLSDPAPMATPTHGRNSISGTDCAPGTLEAPYSTLRHARTATATVRTVERVTVPARPAEPCAMRDCCPNLPRWHGHAARPAVTTDAAHYAAVQVTLAPESMPYPVGAYNAATGRLAPVVEDSTGARWITEAEAAQIANPRAGRRAPERVGTHDGEGGTAPAGSAQAPKYAPVPSGAVPVSPRKRGGAGQTGPTVPGRLTSGTTVDTTAADRARALAAGWLTGTPRG